MRGNANSRRDIERRVEELTDDREPGPLAARLAFHLEDPPPGDVAALREFMRLADAAEPDGEVDR